jgi:hypothetical protein
MPRRKPGAPPKKLGRPRNPNRTPTRRATFTLPVATLDALRDTATERGESQASIVAKGIEKEIGP